MKQELNFFTASSGDISAKVLTGKNIFRHIHSTVDPVSESIYYDNLELWGDVIILLGIGLGYHLSKKIEHINPDAKLIVVDYFEECIEYSQKHFLNRLNNSLITISYFDYHKKIISIQKELKDIYNLKIQTIKHPASYEINKLFYDKLLQDISQIYTPNNSTNTAIQKGMLLYGNFFLQKEIKNALTELLPHPPILFNYENYSNNYNYEISIEKLINIEKPQFILSINMKGIDGNGVITTIAKRFGIPMIVWFVDDPHPILLHFGSFINNSMIAFCWEESFIPFLKQFNFLKVEKLPLATDPNIMSNNYNTVKKYDLGFVGSSMGNNFLNKIKKEFLWNDSFIPIVEHYSDLLVNSPKYKIENIITSLHEELLNIPNSKINNNRSITWLYSLIIHTASMKKRKYIVENLLPYKLNIFGDSDGWRDIFGSNIVTHPNIDYTTQLKNVYNSIMVNINITNCQMETAINQRVFDIPMAGSFLITDYQKDLEILFDIGSEIVCYTSIDELKDRINFYKSNPQECEKISKSAKLRILNQHTYIHRVKTVLSAIKK